MSSTSSAELVDFPSASSVPACEPSPSARLIPIADVSSPSTGQMSLFTTTCEPSPPRALWPTPTINGNYNRKGASATSGDGLATAVLISSAAASPARTSARQERARALAASAAAYGRSTPELLARYDPATSSWRTSQLCLDGELSEFSEIWPRSGTMRNGTAYQLPPLVRLTDEIGSGLWPTPTIDGNYNRKGASATSGDGLATAVQMWPTPTSRDWKHGSAAQFHKPRTEQLNDRIAFTDGGSLNPTWVEWLMGFPLGWTVCAPSATPSSRKSPKSSGGQS